MENIGCALPSLRFRAAPLKRRKGTGHSQGQGWRAGKAAGDLKGAAGKIGSPKCQGGSASSKIPAGSDGKPVAARPAPDEGIFGVPGSLLHPLHAKGIPREPRHPGIQGKSLFLGSPWGGWRRGGAGEALGRLRNNFLFTPLLSRLNADSAPEMSLVPRPWHPVPPPSHPPLGTHPSSASLQLEKAAPRAPRWHLILGAD